MTFAELPILAEGKTKIVHPNPDDDATVYLYFKTTSLRVMSEA